MRLYLVRHGQTTVSSARGQPFLGSLDPPLSSSGVRQMEGIAVFLTEKPIRHVWCSDLLRSHQGASIIARPYQLDPEPYPDFREAAQGIWEGLCYEEASQRYPEEVRAWSLDPANYRIPGGESFSDLQKRVLNRFTVLMDTIGDEEVVLVGHGGTNRIILGFALGLTPEGVFRLGQDHGCLNVVEFFPEGGMVQLLNAAPRLLEGASPFFI